MQRVSMIRLRAVWTLANCCVLATQRAESMRRKFFVCPRPPPKAGEQPMALQELLERRGSRKTGANSLTSTVTEVDRGELASFPWAGEDVTSTGKPRTTPTVPK